MENTRFDGLPDPKANHDGPAALPFGENVFVVADHTGKMVSVVKTRHDAAWEMERFHDANDYEAIMVPVGAVPLNDLRLQ
jgi:hypothetical protein